MITSFAAAYRENYVAKLVSHFTCQNRMYTYAVFFSNKKKKIYYRDFSKKKVINFSFLYKIILCISRQYFSLQDRSRAYNILVC